MNGQVDCSLGELLLDFLDKQSFVHHLMKRPVENPVAFGVDDDELVRQSFLLLFQVFANERGLRQRQLASPGSDF